MKSMENKEQFKNLDVSSIENIPDNDVNTQIERESPEVMFSNREDEFDRKIERDVKLSGLKEDKWLSLLIGATGSALMGLTASAAFTMEARGVTEFLESIGGSSQAAFVGLLGVAAFGGFSAVLANIIHKKANEGLKEMKNEQEN